MVYEVCKKIDADVDKEKVLLTCLNSNYIDPSEMDKFNKTNIYTVERLREKVFDTIICQIPKNVDKEELIERIKKKKDELNNHNINCQKLIKVRRNGGRSSIEIHLINGNEKCGPDQSHIDVFCYQDLMNLIRE